MRKLMYCVDCSVDGFIAREDHTFDFLINEGEHLDEFVRSLKNVDTAIMGRKTYEVGLKSGVIDPSLPMQQYVISSSLKETVDERIKIIPSNATAFIRTLKTNPGKNILLSGGSILAASLLLEGLIDEIELRIHPVFIGSGIPIFEMAEKMLPVQFVNQNRYSNGVIKTVYRKNSM
jgi:dihydrofolate reductase